MTMGHNLARKTALPSWQRRMPRLSKRQVFLLAGTAVLGIGLTLNWNWLTAVGVTPILISLAPCAIMCALGLCMRGGGAKSCATRGGTDEGPQSRN